MTFKRLWQLAVSGVFMMIAVALVLVGCGRTITNQTPAPGAAAAQTAGTVAAAAEDGDGTGGAATATATPAPYTPEPTPTPTITPTPIIYRVQQGDTLISIARQFGVTAQSVQDANGIEDPRLLSVGQSLVIPMDEQAISGLAPTPTPTPAPLTIENMIFSETPAGGLWVLGEAFNTSGTDLEQVKVEVTLLGPNQEKLATAAVFSELDLVAPGARAPFAIHFDTAPDSFANYQAIIVSAVPAYIGSYYRDLQARNTRGTGERYQAFRVRGEVTNIGPEQAQDVEVVVTAYDALGRVVAVRQASPEHNVIPVGGLTTFDIPLIPVAGPVVTYTVTAQGRRLVSGSIPSP